MGDVVANSTADHSALLAKAKQQFKEKKERKGGGGSDKYLTIDADSKVFVRVMRGSQPERAN